MSEIDEIDDESCPMLRLEPLFILFFSFSFHSRDTLHY